MFVFQFNVIGLVVFTPDWKWARNWECPKATKALQEVNISRTDLHPPKIFSPLAFDQPTNQPTKQATNQARERWKDLPFVTDLWWKDALLAFCLVFYTTIQVELFNHSFHIVRFSTLSVCFALITFILMMMTTLSIMIMVMTMKMTWAPFPGMREVDVECETIFSLPGQPSSGWLFLIKFSMGEHHHILLKIIINSLSLLHSLC